MLRCGVPAVVGCILYQINYEANKISHMMIRKIRVVAVTLCSASAVIWYSRMYQQLPPHSVRHAIYQQKRALQ
jgi:hypothetical protein